ncbi:MAG: homocysteine S-methyltransferase family protein [Chloroflexota bacterium]
MSAFMRRIQSGDILVADGATGTNLQEVGLEAGAHTEDWVIDHPDRLLALERAFVDAGADIILTCTFGGTAIRMRNSQYGDMVAEINHRAASLAREAAASGRGVLVGGSMGPVGQLLKPYGPIAYEEALGAYAEQARALAAGGVDLLVIETQFSLDEAKAALEGARTVTDLPAVVSFSYDRGTRTIMGVKPEVAAATFDGLGASMIGVNCGTTLENALAVATKYAAASPNLPIWVKPNAGLPRMDGTKAVYDVTPNQMAEFGRAGVRAGARVLGGCCGSTPVHVRAIADAVNALRGEAASG